MPWRGPEFEGEFPSLGWGLLDFIESQLVIPDGDNAGEPFVPTVEQAEFLIRLCRVNPRTLKYVYSLGQLMWPKGMGKSPFAAAIAWAFAKGPAVPDGWSGSGEPVGRPHPSPWVQVAAVAEDQTENTWRALLPMASPDLGSPITSTFPDIDLGETRIFVGNGAGKLETVTSKAGTREGQRVTFAILDETEYWFHPQGVKLDRTLRRNLAKMSGLAVETCNAYEPGLMSVAERRHLAGKKSSEILLAHRVAPHVEDVTKKRELKKALAEVYGSSAQFVDLDRLVNEFQDDTNDEAENRRFYLNDTRTTADDREFDMIRYDARVKRYTPKDREPITLGFDGSRVQDATVLTGCTRDGHIFPLGWWERPEDAPPDYEVFGPDVDQAVASAFEVYSVARMYCDPHFWRDYIDNWAERYGRKTVVNWDTRRDKAMDSALDRIGDALGSNDAPLSFDSDPRQREHFANAVTAKRGKYRRIRKEHNRSPLHIDGAMSATLAYEARGDALAAGEMKPKRRRRAASF